MPTLYNLVQGVREFFDNSLNKIEKIYLTGTGCVINNIDLYFQEYFKEAKCEILKPYFISDSVKISIKDYIEVNSAIALAMQGLGYGIDTINFKKPKFMDKLPDWMKIEKKPKTVSGKQSKNKANISLNLKGQLDNAEKGLLRGIAGILVFFILYSGVTIFLNSETQRKLAEVNDTKQYTSGQIDLVTKDIQTLNNKATDYTTMVDNLKNYSDQVASNMKSKNVIPLLLTRIMNVIPDGVTLTSIENTTGSHIVINAQSADYDLLGFFKGSLIVDGILSPSTVISTSGVKQNGIVKIVIEGDLP